MTLVFNEYQVLMSENAIILMDIGKTMIFSIMFLAGAIMGTETGKRVLK